MAEYNSIDHGFHETPSINRNLKAVRLTKRSTTF